LDWQAWIEGGMGCLCPKRQDEGQALGKVITQPTEGEPVPEPKAAGWKGEEGLDETVEGQAKKSDGY
jgi:hypothetical protein